MLGVRLKTWVKAHLGRERNHSSSSSRSPNPSFASSSPFPVPSSFSPYYPRAQYLQSGASNCGSNVINPDQSTSSNGSARAGGLALLSSPDTGYSTDGLSNSNIINTPNSTNSPSSISTPTTTALIQQHLSQHSTIAKRRDWFLQNVNASTLGNPPISPPIHFRQPEPSGATSIKRRHQLPPPHQQSTTSSLKPTRIKTNPWYNPKSKRLSSSSPKSVAATGVAAKKTQDNHIRHSTCTTTTADSGEGSFDSQKSSPRVSFSSSSLESCKLDDWKAKIARQNRISNQEILLDTHTGKQQQRTLGNYCSRDDEVVVVGKSPYKRTSESWYQPQQQQPSAFSPSSKTSSFSPYFIHTSSDEANHVLRPFSANHAKETLTPNEGASKRRPFGFLKKLFKKGQSKKNKNSSSTEVSLHDLYYHQTSVPVPVRSAAIPPNFVTHIQSPPSIPPRVSSFLTPTPNAFRRRFVNHDLPDEALTRRNLTPNLGYNYREPLIRAPPSFRTPILGRPESKTELLPVDPAISKFQNAYATTFNQPSPTLSSVYCTPSPARQTYQQECYSQSPRRDISELISTQHNNNSIGTSAAIAMYSPVMRSQNHNNSQLYQQNGSCQQETPSRRAHIVNKNLLLGSPTPYTNNSSYSPIHRVAVLKGNNNPNPGFGKTNPPIMNFTSHTFTKPLQQQQQRPEFFSPQLPPQQHLTRNNSSTAHSNSSTAFFSPQPRPAQCHDSRRRCFQYISSSNQNSPILNAHRQPSIKTGQQPPPPLLQQQTLFNRLSPIIQSNLHRVHPVKNFLQQQQSSCSSNGSPSCRMKNSPKLLNSSPIARNSNIPPPIPSHACNIEKIYEEIDDDDDDEVEEEPLAADDEDDDEPTDDDPLLKNCETINDAHPEEDINKLVSSQQYSDEGDEQGGDYYQFDYDSSLLSTTDETSQEQTSTASTSTLLKTGEHQQLLHGSNSQLQPLYNVVEKKPQRCPTAPPLLSSTSEGAGAAAAVASIADILNPSIISPTTRQLLEIENDLRFCRLIAEAQSLLRELESSSVSLSATRVGLEAYYKQSHTSLRKPLASNSISNGRHSSSTNGSSNTYRRNHRSSSSMAGGGNGSGTSSSSGPEECCPQSDPLRRKAYECWALRRLQQELAGCCASPLAFRHNLVPRQQLQKRRPSGGGGLNL